MNHKRNNIILGIMLAILATIIIPYTFFNQSEFHEFLSTKIILAHIYAFPILFGTIMGLISVFAIGIICYRVRSAFYKNTECLLWFISLILCLLWIVYDSGPGIIKHPSSTSKTFKILAWNTQDNIEKDDIYLIFKTLNTDIAVFPELEGYGKGENAEKRLKDIFKLTDLNFNDYNVFTSPANARNIAAVTIVIKKTVSKYKVVTMSPSTTFGTLYLQAKDDTAPDIVGLHAAPPLPGLMDAWKQDLNLIVSDIITKHANTFIIGDFNATLRHGPLNHVTTHQDALHALSRFRRGTWPSNLPSYFRTPIDHILLPKDAYDINHIEILDIGTSDHNAIFTEISGPQK